MRQHVQGRQTGPQRKAPANNALDGASANSSSVRLATPVLVELVPEGASLSHGELEGSANRWAIELQETQCLPPVRRPFPPTPPSASPVPHRDEPRPNLGARPLGITLLCCLLLLLVVGALDGMQQYARIHAQVDDAYIHLQAAATLLHARQPGLPLTTVTLEQVSNDLEAAQADFDALQAELGTPSGVVLLGTFVPHLSARIATAASLARGGDTAIQGLQALVAASNDILELRADGFLDANGDVTRRGRLSPASGLLMLHLDTALANAAGPLSAADTVISPANLTLLPSTLATPAQLATLHAQLADWPQMRSHLLAPDGWRLLIPFALGTQSASR